MRGRRIKIGMHEFFGWLGRLFRQPIFLFVTAWGHLSIFGGAVLFRHFEQAGGLREISFFDAYYWAISTATTTGMADIAPFTQGGKLVAIFVMIVGSLFLWSYAALFAASVVMPKLQRVGAEVRELESGMEEMERGARLDQATLQQLLHELQRLQAQAEKPR